MIRSRRGFTMVELLIAMTTGLVVLSAVYAALIAQSREYQQNRERRDVAETLRSAAVLLSSELQHASAAGGDLYAISSTSLTLRSYQASGIVCGAAPPRYGIWQPSNTFTSTSDDSAFAYQLSPATWHTTKVSAVWTNPGSPYVANCSWVGAKVPPQVIELAGDTAGVGVGSLVRSWRKTQYGLVSQNGRWWLGRRIGSAVTWDIVTGPLRSDVNGGLAFVYYDASGNVTATLTAVARVDIVLRAESYRVIQQGSTVGSKIDSVTAKVFLRN
jgi:prepilin-type N-terminal cleavage/methylation domain-containing protein